MSKPSRRQFLRNTALTTLSAGVLPVIASANTPQPEKNKIDCNPTTRDYFGLGPFYIPNQPALVNNQLAETNEPGTRLILSGIVQTLDCTAVIPDTVIDIWHANDAGEYGNNLRGITHSNAQGFYTFETILPGKYLNGGTHRPSHIHFKIIPPGFPELITQLYFEGDSQIPGDAAASITSGTFDATHRIIPITMNTDGKYEGTWDIAIAGDGTTGTGDIHLDKGIIYAASPSPFSDNLEINYGVFKPGKVTIQVFNMNGSLVASLDELQLKPGKYKAKWQADRNLSNGIYWISLKLNDMQAHYLKVVKV